MVWVLDHEDHDIVEKDDETFHCRTCDVDIPKHPDKGRVTVSGSVELEDGSLSGEVGIRKDFGST